MTNEQILNDAFEAGRRKQLEELVIDFDQAIESQRKKAIKIKYKGKMYAIPHETPQWYMNIIARKLHETRSLDFSQMSEEEIIEKLEVNDREHDEIFRRLFGDEFVDAYLSDNMVSRKVLTEDLLNPILVKWGWMPAQVTEKKSLKNS